MIDHRSIKQACELGRERCRWCWEESQMGPSEAVYIPDVDRQYMPSLQCLYLPPDREFEAIWHMAQVGL